MHTQSRARLRRAAAVITLSMAPAAGARADDPIQVNPNRPTFATPALTTQFGVMEMESGVQHSDGRDGEGRSWSPFLLKLGVLKRLELRIGGNGLVRQTQADTPPVTGFGDTTVGAQWCYLHHGLFGADEAVQFTWKLPTASAAKGLGSGEPDGTFMILFSRDLGRFHADANALVTWLGRPGLAGSDRQPAVTLSVSRTLNDRWSVTGEVYSIGATPQNPLIVSNLWAVGYKPAARLVLDGGVDVGVSHGAPKLSLFAGLTVGVCRFRHGARS
jgi:outer membrane putative beta-barrel porin/alpha-amylase